VERGTSRRHTATTMQLRSDEEAQVLVVRLSHILSDRLFARFSLLVYVTDVYVCKIPRNVSKYDRIRKSCGRNIIQKV
jgi:hypothetical protein